jgi:hypothetical protein
MSGGNLGRSVEQHRGASALRRTKPDGHRPMLRLCLRFVRREAILLERDALQLGAV